MNGALHRVGHRKLNGPTVFVHKRQRPEQALARKLYARPPFFMGKAFGWLSMAQLIPMQIAPPNEWGTSQDPLQIVVFTDQIGKRWR